MNKKEALFAVVIVLLAAFAIGIMLLPQEVQEEENIIPAVVTVTPSATKEPLMVVPGPRPEYLGDIFASKLYVLDQEEALVRLNFFEPWMNITPSNYLNVENAEIEMDQAVRGSSIDPRFRVRFIPGGNIKKIVFASRHEVLLKENVVAETLPDTFVSYLIEKKDPMDRRGLAKIDIVKTFSGGNLVAISWADPGAIKLLKRGGSDSGGDSGGSDSGSDSGGDGGGGDGGGGDDDSGGPSDSAPA